MLVYRHNRIVYINRAGEQLLGYAEEALTGASLDSLFSADQREGMVGRLRRAGRGEPTAFTAELIRSDGLSCTGEVVASAARYAHEPASVAVVRDVSERTQLEHKLRVSDRLASIGRLASGVGHEINNPLTTVIANLYEAAETVQAIAPSAGPIEELRHSLDEARRGADRVRGIVADLRLLSRIEEDGETVLKSLDLRPLVAQTIQLARYETRHRAEIFSEMGEIIPVLGNARRLSQVVLNLLVNAAEAMDGRRPGRIDVRVRPGEDAVILEVQDNGRGMSPEALAHAADPFFTTKDIGEGTGLGLALCYGVAEAHGGALVIESEQGVGTLVRLTLPAAASRLMPGRTAPNVAPVQPAPAVEVASSDRARVLVVNDEETLGRAFVRLLRTYDATAVLSGAAALEAWDAEPFDVVICDLMMPEMTGAELYAALLERDPTIGERFILMTGGACTPDTELFLAASGLQVLYKPVPPPTLREVVAERVTRIRARAAGAA